MQVYGLSLGIAIPLYLDIYVKAILRFSDIDLLQRESLTEEDLIKESK